MNVAIITGTRPEIIKLAPIIKQLKKNNRSIIFSGQHYDFDLGLGFFKELELPQPDYKLKIGKNSAAIQIGEIICKLQSVLSDIKPDTVMVHGDTNTALAGAICALKMGIPINHVESGLRSFDWRMPEEHNRIEVDHISDLLFASTKISKQNLQMERVHGKIFVTGNTVMDAIELYMKMAEKKSSVNIDENFILLTMHRAENVDNKETLKGLVAALVESSEKILFPIHPRTLKRLKQFDLYSEITKSGNIKLLNIIGYFDMLKLMKNCRYIITDSGGIQEEATSPIIRKKVLVIRKTTDRPEAVTGGFSQVVGTSKQGILKAMREIMKDSRLINKQSPYGNGESSKMIVSILKKFFK